MATNDTIAGEILVSFWKAHVLHHAAAGPVYGLWLLAELAEHGYRLSPGTLYPLLARMERKGWLRAAAQRGPRGRKEYRITASGRRALRAIQGHVDELHRELVREAR